MIPFPLLHGGAVNTAAKAVCAGIVVTNGVVAKIIHYLIDGVSVGNGGHIVAVAVELNVKLFVLNALFKGYNYLSSHLADIKRHGREFALARLNTRKLKQGCYKS